MPIEPDVSEATLVDSGWETILSSAEAKECFAYTRVLRPAAEAAGTAGDADRSAGLTLILQACEPSLRPEDDEVLAPYHLVVALSGPQLDALAAFLPHITDAELSARVGDILWLRRRDRKSAEVAVASYLQSSRTLEDPKNWVSGFVRTERALRLAASLGKKSQLFTDVVAHVEQTLERLGGTDPLYLSAKLMELLLEQRVGDPVKYGEHASAMAAGACSAHDWRRAETLFDIAARWFDLAKDATRARESRRLGAEAYVSLAAETASAGQHGVAAVHLQHAIEAYRRVGKEQARVEALLQILREYQESAVGEFQTYSTSVDLSGEVKRAMDSVRGKPTLPDALLALVMVSASPSVATMREGISSSARESPMQYLFPRVVVDAKTGRTTGRRGGATDEDVLEDATFEHARMVQHMTACVVEPARRVVCEEHHVFDADLLGLVRNSPFVPPGHEVRFARGLAAGLRGDFMLSTALLVPLVEAALRYVVEQNGGRAYGLDDDGIQDAHQLDHLLSLDLVQQALGEDVVFDLRGLLIERFGSNLRHLEAHGLLDDAQCSSTAAAYFWWLTLRLCVLFALVAGRRGGARSAEPATKAQTS